MQVESGLQDSTTSHPLAAMGARVSATAFKEDSGSMSKVDTT